MKEIIKKMAREQILKVNPYQPGKPIEEVKRELGLSQVIKLASNENNLGPSPKAVAAVRTAAEQINRYPDGGCFYLKQKLSEKLGVNPSNLILGNGSDEVIIFCLRAFIDPGDEIVIARPTFLVYNIGGVVSGAEVVQIPMKDFRYDLKAMKEAIGLKTKAVFIANPDNPVGCYVTKSELDDFFDKLKDDVIVFIDEAYFEFAQDLDDYPDTLNYLNRKNIIITRTFSKAYGLSGLRVGYGIATEAMIDCLNRVREPFNVNSLAQAAALAALDDHEYLNKSIQMVAEGKDYLYAEFKKLGLKYLKSAANFIIVDLETDANHVFDQMLEQGLIIRDMGVWGLKTFIRVTIGRPEENKKFIEILKKILKTES